jgi:uncharacterized membrane protein
LQEFSQILAISEKILSSVSRGEFFRGLRTSLNRDVMYPKFKDLKKHHKLLASLIIAIAFISIWRGVWRLFDYYVFPNNFVLSSVTTLILGIVILIITHHKLT